MLTVVWSDWSGVGQMVFFFYLLSVNLSGFFLMGSDKSRAQQRKSRLPEKMFFLLAFAGAVPGLVFGMRSFRHKTKKAAFRFGLPLVFMVQMVALMLWLRR